MKTKEDKRKARRAYEAEYRKKNREKIRNAQRQRRQTLKYKYIRHRGHAKERGIEWLFTFDSWKKVWEDSGKIEDRGVTGYQMCRYNDTGPYSPDNVYIALGSENKADAYYNGVSWLAQQHKK